MIDREMFEELLQAAVDYSVSIERIKIEPRPETATEKRGLAESLLFMHDYCLQFENCTHGCRLWDRHALECKLQDKKPDQWEVGKILEVLTHGN